MISLKKINVGLYSNNHRPISLKLGMMIKTTKLYILISVWVILSFTRGHRCIRNVLKKIKKIKNDARFLANLSIDTVEIQYVATTCWFVETHARFILRK